MLMDRARQFQRNLKTSPRQCDKKELLIVAGIFALALLVRVVHLYESSSNPSFLVPTIDSETYDKVARAVATGKGMNYNFFWQPFFYPLFLSLVYTVSNSSIVWAKVVQVLLGCITCVLTYRLGRRIFNRTTGIVAGLITALYGPLIFFEAELLASGWAVFWSVVLIFVLLECASRKTLWISLIVGLFGGLSILTRPTFLPFFIAAFAWLAIVLYRSIGGRSGLAMRLGAILVGLVAVMIPVAVLNFRVTGHFDIMPSTGGLNLYIGNNDNYDETINARPGAGWEELLDLPRRNGVFGDLWNDQEFFKQKVVEFIVEEPMLFVKGIGSKTLQFFSSREMPRTMDIYVFRKWSCLLGLLTWKLGQFGFPFGAILPLVLLGMISYWRQLPVPVVLFVVLYPLSVILVFVAARYRTPVIPVFSILVGAGLLSLIETVRTRNLSRLIIAVITTIFVVLFSSLPGPFPSEKPNFEAELYRNVAAIENNIKGNAQQAFLHAQKAIELMPEFASAHETMGEIFRDMGKLDSAVESFEKALSLKPDLTVAHINLGIVLGRQDRFEQAIRHFNKALEIVPYDPKAHDNLGIALASQGRPEEAAAHFKLAVKFDPDNANAHNNLGYALANLGRLDEAIKHYAKALQIDPGFVLARRNLKQARQQQVKGERNYQELTDNAGTLNKLGADLVQQGKFAQSIKYFTKALQIDPNSADTHRNLGYALFRQGMLDEAVKHLNEALRIKPDLAMAHNDLGVVLVRQGKFDQAITHFEEALRIMPNLTSARRSLEYLRGRQTEPN